MPAHDLFLVEHPFFKGIPVDLLAVVAADAAVVEYPAGSYVFREGGEAVSCWLLQKGDVALEMHAPGLGVRTIQTVHSGEVLGWSWLFPPYRWSFDAHVREPVRALELNAERMLGLAEADCIFGYELMHRFAAIIVDRLQATRIQLLDLYAAPS